MTEIDILEIHNQILQDFESNRQKIEYYKTQILDIDKSLEIEDLSHRIEKRLLIKGRKKGGGKGQEKKDLQKLLQ